MWGGEPLGEKGEAVGRASLAVETQPYCELS